MYRVFKDEVGSIQMAYDKYVDEKELKMRITLPMKKLEGTMLMDPIGDVLL